MEQTQSAELRDRAGVRVGKVRVSLWTRPLNGYVDWGGGIQPEEEVVAIEPGLYVLRLEDGHEAQIIINNVRNTSVAGPRIFSAATFLGNDRFPFN